MLIAFQPCCIHALHRAVLPILKVQNVSGALYRLALALHVTSFWRKLTLSIKATIDSNLIVIHNASDIEHRNVRISSEILRLTIAGGLPDAYISDKIRAQMKEWSDSLIGDWSSDLVKYHCRAPGCTGEGGCREAAVDHVCKLFMKGIFGSKWGVPAVSRWWKVAPVARRVMLGVSCHNMLGRAAPRKYKPGDAAGGDGDAPNEFPDAQDVSDDHFQMVHNWRIKKSFEFLNKVDTPMNLVIMLVCLRVPHSVMAWLMAHDSCVGATGTDMHQPAFDPPPERGARAKMSRRDALINFVNPLTSPVLAALSTASRSLQGATADEAWAAAVPYCRGQRGQAYRAIWDAAIPCYARVWWKLFHRCINAFPLKLALLLGSSQDLRDAVCQEFANLESCCVPRGIAHLKNEVADASACLEGWFITLVEEMVSQWDLTIYDREVAHAHCRASLSRSNNTGGFANIMMEELGLEIGSDFTRSQCGGEEPEPPKRGRPPGNSRTKRKRFDAWNAFVQASRPDGTAPLCISDNGKKSIGKQADIHSGAFLKRVSMAWKAASPEMRNKYNHIATMEQAAKWADEELGSHDAEECEEGGEELDSKDDARTWTIGSPDSPLCEENLSTPLLSPTMAEEVQQWLDDVKSEVPHVPCLPKKVKYDKACVPGCCCRHPCYGRAVDMRSAFGACLMKAYLVMGECLAGYVSRMFLAAHVQQRPEFMIVLPLELAGGTLRVDLESGVNFPWHLELARRHSEFMDSQLGFQYDLTFFCDILAEADALGIEDVVCMEMTYDVVGYNRMAVTHTNKLCVISGCMHYMSDIADPKLADDSDVDEMQALNQNGANPPDADEEPDEEYDFDIEELSLMKKYIKEFHKHADSDAVPPPPPPPPPAAGVATAPKKRVRIDWESYDQYRGEVRGRYTDVVNSEGKVVGQLQYFGVGAQYKMAALCYCSHHEGKCSRSRTAKPHEQPIHVDRILFKWLVEGHRHASTTKHMDAFRD